MPKSPPASAMVDDASLTLVFRRLQLSAETDRALVRAACRTAAEHRSGADLHPQPGRLLLLSGWACRARVLADGRRQIISFFLPGDPIDIPAGGEPALYRTLALSRCRTLDASDLDGRISAEPQAHETVRLALERSARDEAVRQVDHIIRLGALEAYGAMAHLLLEFRTRSAATGLMDGERFPLQVSQDTLGEALGLSQVHANRVLAQLRRDGLLELGPGWARLLDLHRLAVAAGHAPAPEVESAARA